MACSSTGRPQRGAAGTTQTVTWFLPEGAGGLTTSFTRNTVTSCTGSRFLMAVSVCMYHNRAADCLVTVAVTIYNYLFLSRCFYLRNWQSACLPTFSTVTIKNSGDCLLAGLSVENSQLFYSLIVPCFLFRAYCTLLHPSFALSLSDGAKSWRQ